METVSATKVATAKEANEERLPPPVAEALGELVGQAREGLMALSVAVGLEVMHELMACEVEELAGPKGKHDPDRTAVRHGQGRGSVTLGGRRLRIRRPRVRSADDRDEVKVRTHEHFASRDPLAKVVLERMLGGVGCRRFRRAAEPIGSEVEATEASTSRSSISRTFVERTRTALAELMNRRLDDVRLAVPMLDGIELEGRTNVVALGITSEGVKVPLGLWEGSTENAAVGHGASGRPGRARTGHLAVRPRRARRREGAPQGGAGRARLLDAGAALPATQGAECPRAPSRARSPRRQAAPRVGLEADRPRDRARAAFRPRRRARPHPPRCRRLAARGDGRDAHPHPARDRQQAARDALLDQLL